MTEEGKPDKRRAIAGWGIALLTIWILLDVLVGGASLVVEVDTPTDAWSRVHYRSDGGTYSDQDVVRIPIRAGKNEVTYALPHIQKRVRWHPIEGSGSVDVRSIHAKVWWSSVEIPLDTVRSGFHVASAELRQGQVLHVETPPRESSPQLVVTLPVAKLFFLRQLGAASVSAIVLGLLFACLRLDGVAARAVDRLRRAIADEGPALKALPYLIAIAFAFHFSSLAAFSLSPDDEASAYRTNPNVWVAQGRWTVYFIEGFVLTQPTVPFLPDAIFCMCAALAYVLIVRAHGLAVGFRTYALFPLFCAFPTWAYIVEFYGNLPSASLGLLLSSAGALAYQRTFVHRPSEPPSGRASRRIGLGIGVQALLLGTAIGAYQSYLFAFVAFGLGIVLLTAHSDPAVSPRRIAVMLIGLMASSAAGYCVYAAAQKLMLAITGVSVSYIDTFLKPELFLAHPASRLEFLVDELKSIYSGSDAIYGASFGSIAGIVVLGATAILCAGRLAENGVRKAMLLLFASSVLTLPVALMALAPDLPLRALVGVPYAVWLFGVLSLTHQLQIPRVAGAVAVLTGGFQMAYLLSLYAASTALAGNHNRMMAEAVYARIAAANENFDRRRVYRVDFYGQKVMNLPRYPMVPSSTIGRGFFDWDGGNGYRIVLFMSLLGFDNLQELPPNERLPLVPAFNDMPFWPAEGSVKVVNDTTLIKLSPYPDPTHVTNQ